MTFRKARRKISIRLALSALGVLLILFTSFAIERFVECLDLREDGAADLLRGRCAVQREDPPPDDWNGVFGMKKK